MAEIPVDRIDLDLRMWPLGEEADQEAIERLVDTLRHGAGDLLNPVLVRAARGSAARFDLIAGRVRLNAARATGMPTIPCRIIEADDVQCAAIQIIEQGCRRDWPTLELGWLLAQLQDRLRAYGERCEVRDLARRLGFKKKSQVSESLNTARAIPLNMVETVARTFDLPVRSISSLTREPLREIRRAVTLEQRAELLQAAADAIAAGADVEASVSAAAKQVNPPFRVILHSNGFCARVPNVSDLSAAEREAVAGFLRDALSMLSASNQRDGREQAVKCRFSPLGSFATFARRTSRTLRVVWNRVLRRVKTAGTV